MRRLESHSLWPAGAVLPPDAAPFPQGCDRRAPLSARQMTAFPPMPQAKAARADPAAVLAGGAPARGPFRMEGLPASRPAHRYSCCARARVAEAGRAELAQVQLMAN